jgi:hypothetical protein
MRLVLQPQSTPRQRGAALRAGACPGSIAMTSALWLAGLSRPSDVITADDGATPDPQELGCHDRVGQD